MITLSHIGIVVENIEDYLKFAVHPTAETVIFDPIQHSRLALIKTNTGRADIELVEPADEQATTYNFLKKTGGGLHHLCYEINSEKDLDELLKQRRIKRFFGPVKAALFEGRKIVFGYTKNREIIEFIITE